MLVQFLHFSSLQSGNPHGFILAYSARRNCTSRHARILGPSECAASPPALEFDPVAFATVSAFAETEWIGWRRVSLEDESLAKLQRVLISRNFVIRPIIVGQP